MYSVQHICTLQAQYYNNELMGLHAYALFDRRAALAYKFNLFQALKKKQRLLHLM